ncbi:lantibiotic dehydratase [Nonomuraea rubra]|uniref:lantibiotic dehydratase n=1 Tax=Nonomuraea rubra TaxID=46180 RepID=UPI0033FE3EAE
MTPEPRYRALSGLVVRAPMLPAAAFSGLGGFGGSNSLRWRADPDVAFAVAVASPDLTAALTVSPADAQVQAALQRYLIRAATRPTPFGGFAAAGVARWSDRTDLEIAPVRRPTRTRVDMAWLTEVAERLSRDPACRASCRLYANTCAIEHAGRLYLADPSTGGIRTGPDVSVRATTVVRRALALSRSGMAADELRRRILLETPAATPDKVDRLLDRLSEQQFLLPELLPALLGDPLAHVVKCLDGMPGTAAAAWSSRLSDIGAACRAVDAATDPVEATAALAAARALLGETVPPDLATAAPSAVRAAPAGLSSRADVQLDTALPLSGTGVTRAIADDVGQAVDVLFRLHPGRARDPLAGYRARFHRRYGEHRRVRLLELLDPRFGLGPLQAHQGEHDGGHRTDPEAVRRRSVTLRNLVATAMREGLSEVMLDDTLLERLSSGVPEPARLPSSIELSVFVGARSRAAVDRGDYLLVVGPNLGGQAAGRGLGRFAGLIGTAASNLLAEAAEAVNDVEAVEDAEAAVVAELVYRPLRARSANVAVRPLVGEYELPVGVAPTLPPDRVVHADELSVGLADERFQVWWDTVDRPLTLTSGHMLNPAAAPPVCRALLRLTSDGRLELPGFDWGPMAEMPYLPRVRRGRVVLAPAQWRPTGADLGDAFGTWRARWLVPRLVYLASADNRLLLDLDDEAHVAQLRAAMPAAPDHVLVLHEALPGPDEAWLPGPRGRHIVELVVPLVRTASAAGLVPATDPGSGTGSVAVAGAGLGEAERRRPPGSDWLYVTLDGPARNEDELLAGSLGELADTLVERGDAYGWYFVRYADPDRQLRLRLHGTPSGLTERVLPEVTRWAAGAIRAGLRTRMGLETYERELERYGGPGTTAICEALACVDSSTVRGLLRPGDLDRVELGLVSTSDLLGSLVGEDLAERVRWLKATIGAHAHAGAVFRERKVRLRALVHACDEKSWDGIGGPWPQVGEMLARRRSAMAPLVRRLRSAGETGSDALEDARVPAGSRALPELAVSLLHLHANRLGLDWAAEHLVLGLLDRTLRSLLAHRPSRNAVPVQEGSP